MTLIWPGAVSSRLLAAPPTARGIAQSYPRDQGIASDPDVLFADDFETYTDATELPKNWDAGVYHKVRIATEPENVYAGKRALEFTLPQQRQEMSNEVARALSPTQDVVFLRYYTKFDPLFDITGSCHNGVFLSGGYFPGGHATPGVRADGSNKFLASLESWRDNDMQPSPGRLNVYVYYPEQRSQWGDHFFPSGEVLPLSYKPGNFGDTFEPHTDITPHLGQWVCFELMVRANNPGRRNGRITVWMNGAVVADFPGLRLRDTDTLKMDRVDLAFHAASNPVREVRKWYDDVVVAKRYIGPMVRRSRSALTPPSNP